MKLPMELGAGLVNSNTLAVTVASQDGEPQQCRPLPPSVKGSEFGRVRKEAGLVLETGNLNLARVASNCAQTKWCQQSYHMG
jgi:hypothetical protein